MNDEGSYDPLDDLLPASREALMTAVTAVLTRDEGEDGPLDPTAVAEVIRAAEPLWNALEEFGVVDSWGGLEFVRVFPAVLEHIVTTAN